jgi:hypothetical protein
MNIHAVLHIPTLHGKIFEGIFPMWKCVKLLPSKQTKSNLTFTIYCPNFGGNYSCLRFVVNLHTWCFILVEWATHFGVLIRF